MVQSKTDNITYLRIESYSDHPEVGRAAKQLVESYMVSRIRVKETGKYLRDAKKLIASLWLRGEDDQFRFTTKTTYYSPASRKQVWMTNRVLKLFRQMIALGWIALVKEAVPPHSSKKSTGGLTAIYCRTRKFRDLLKTLSITDVVPNPDMPRVELRDENENLQELPDAYLSTTSCQATFSILEQHYALLTASDICFADGSPMPLSKLYFVRKYRPDFQHGGRIYAGFQNLPKKDRLGITINGESVASLDISQLHPALILRLTHREDRERSGMLFEALPEVYDMPDYPDLPRAVNKKMINALINAPSEDSAARSLMNHYYWWDLLEEKWVVRSYKGRQKRTGGRVFDQEKPLKAAKEYIAMFNMRHAIMSDAVCSGIGTRLQLLDGQLMEAMISVATAAGVPILPVHDELIIQEKYKTFAVMLLKRAFQVTFKEAGRFGFISVKWMSLLKEELIQLSLADGE
jgi:hypothetical protein